jgi:integrase/recombinase XerD
MNQRTSGFLLSDAILGFQQYKTAAGLSPRTGVSYEQHLRVWLRQIGDRDISMVATRDITAFLAWLHNGYTPQRRNGGCQPLSRKTVRNFWITLMSFFHWASAEFNLDNPMKGVPGPKFEDTPIEPFRKEQVEVLLKECEFCRNAKTQYRRSFSMRRSTAARDRAIVLMLLDTGLRASELCSLRIGDIDQANGQITIRSGSGGGAKGGKGRVVFLGKITRQAVWRYLSKREDRKDEEAPFFLGKFQHPINAGSLRLLLVRLGNKAGVQKCHPHRFRHTFAITYLRSGGDIFTLQALLGHNSLDMVRHYAAIAQLDIEQAHRRASPADNWRL